MVPPNATITGTILVQYKQEAPRWFERAQVAKRSDYFKAMLDPRAQWQEQEIGIVRLKGFPEVEDWIVNEVLEFLQTGNFDFDQIDDDADQCETYIHVWNIANYFQSHELLANIIEKFRSFLNDMALNLLRMKHEKTTRLVAWDHSHAPNLMADVNTEFEAAIRTAYADPAAKHAFSPLIFKFLRLAGFRFLTPESLLALSQAIPDFGADVMLDFANGRLQALGEHPVMSRINPTGGANKPKEWRLCSGAPQACALRATPTPTFILDGGDRSAFDHTKWWEGRHAGRTYCELCVEAGVVNLV